MNLGGSLGIGIPAKGDLCITTVIPVKTGIQWRGRDVSSLGLPTPRPTRTTISEFRKGLRKRECTGAGQGENDNVTLNWY